MICHCVSILIDQRKEKNQHKLVKIQATDIEKTFAKHYTDKELKGLRIDQVFFKGNQQNGQ